MRSRQLAVARLHDAFEVTLATCTLKKATMQWQQEYRQNMCLLVAKDDKHSLIHGNHLSTDEAAGCLQVVHLTYDQPIH